MKILIVDDEANIQKTTSVALRTMGHQALTAFSGNQALKRLGEDRIDAVFLDLRLGEESGLDVFERIRAEGYNMPVIMFTAYSSIETAIEATRRGVFDYIAKPFVPEQIRQALKKLEENRSLARKVDDLEGRVASQDGALCFDSKSPAMQNVFELAERASLSDANILLTGPSGTGKSTLARRIHEASDRASGAFVVAHCPSFSKELLESELFGHVKGAFTGAIKDTWGKVEAADEGTLFLDEIGDIPPEAQAKLLRLLQDRQYERVGETKTRQANARILAATNKDLQEEVRANRFREDLFYRLNVITLELPGLSHRKEDLQSLIDIYLTQIGAKLGRGKLELTDPAKAALIAYDWPGNLRELNNVVERCAILVRGNSIDVGDLPLEIRGATNSQIPAPSSNAIFVGSTEATLEELENEHIKRLLETGNSLEEVASMLGIDTATLYRKRKKLDLL